MDSGQWSVNTKNSGGLLSLHLLTTDHYPLTTNRDAISNILACSSIPELFRAKS